MLLPPAWLFAVAVAGRREAYRRGWLRSVRVGVPVVVVGNVTVGGTGKTPLVIWIVHRLRALGYTPGVVSRGYGGERGRGACRVFPDSDPGRVGDEPVLIARRTGCPIAVAADRVAAARLLLPAGVDVIVSDDGLQHYRLGRDLEIAVVDGERGLGNGRLLPAGPLRESPKRLQYVDQVIDNGGINADMTLKLGDALPLSGGPPRPLASFQGQRVHALAGIGHPPRFFAALKCHGLAAVEHPFADHHRFKPPDMAFEDSAPVLMTEKDATKCRRFIRPGLWAVPAHACLTGPVSERLESLLRVLPPSPGPAAR